MGYFEQIAKRHFMDSPGGDRLFHHFSVWSRPYIIPNNETEARLVAKQVWVEKVVLIVILCCVIPTEKWGYSISFVAALFFAFTTVGLFCHFVFRNELAKLERATIRTSFLTIAYENTTWGLVASLFVSLVFVIIGMWLFVSGDTLEGVVCSAFSIYSTLVYGYILILKTYRDTDALPK